VRVYSERPTAVQPYAYVGDRGILLTSSNGYSSPRWRLRNKIWNPIVIVVNQRNEPCEKLLPLGQMGLGERTGFGQLVTAVACAPGG